MIGRTTIPSNSAYEGYGSKGIAVCDRWMEFRNFYEDMGSPPKGMTLDRRENDKGYSPENCRWATPKQQANNRISNRVISAFGRVQTLQQWAEESGIGAMTIKERLNSGWSHERAVSVLPWAERPNVVLIEAFGRRKTAREWSEEVGVGYSTLRERLKRGWSPEDAIQKPTRKYGSHC